MNLETVTPLIITYNESPNIARTLDGLAWAKRIVIVDSGSDDGTLDVLARYPAVDLFHRAFDSFAAQCNFGLEQIATPWVLSIDADYVLSDAVLEEIRQCSNDAVSGYSVPFVYRVYGRPLRATLYPRRTVLYRKSLATYADEGHGHRVRINGVVEPLRNVVFHDDRKPMGRWFSSQQRYAATEAEYLLNAKPQDLRRTDMLRLWAWPVPLLVFFYTLIAKRCILDGWPGWVYALQRTCAEIMIALAIIDRRMRR
jgi:glycosyltransferase involved in cell wall biosynthesis